MKMHRVTAALLLVAISSAAAAQWANICASQPVNRTRGCDSQGCGGYNPRGGRKHRGVDVVCEDGSVVYTPFTGQIDNQARPWGNIDAIDNGAQLSGSGFCIKMFYIKPIRYSGSIKKGEKIVLPMQSVYQGTISRTET